MRLMKNLLEIEGWSWFSGKMINYLIQSNIKYVTAYFLTKIYDHFGNYITMIKKLCFKYFNFSQITSHESFTCRSLGQSSLLSSSQTFLAWTLNSKTVPSFFLRLSSFSFFCWLRISILVRGFFTSSPPSIFSFLPANLICKQKLL